MFEFYKNYHDGAKLMKCVNCGHVEIEGEYREMKDDCPKCTNSARSVSYNKGEPQPDLLAEIELLRKIANEISQIWSKGRLPLDAIRLKKLLIDYADFQK